jgi:hypothetical protein
MTTIGDSVASTTLNELLLDPTKEYVCRVTELTAPVNNIPLFGFNAAGAPANTELFRVKTRIALENLALFQFQNETDGFGAPGQNLGFSSRLRTIGAGERVYTSPSSFITEMGRHSNNITQGLDEVGGFAVNGLPADSKHEYFNLRINADSCVEFVGSSVFWNNFCIQFTELGKILFGVQSFVDANNIMGISTHADNTIKYTIFHNDQVIDFANDPDYVIAVDTLKIIGGYPLFKHLDHRYFVSVETDLLVQQSIKVVDGVQTVDRSICKTFFPTNVKVNLQSEGGVLKEDVDLQIETGVGQHAFIKKTSPSEHWVSLQTSYDVRFFRFHLYVTYLTFDEGSKLFLYQRKKYPISLNDSWDISLEFVSKL